MTKLNISINLLALQGACKGTIKGEECIIIRLPKARAKPHQNGKVYLNLEAVANKDGKDQYGNTHFIVEPTTKEEREDGLKLPIIGNGKTYEPKGHRQERRPDQGFDRGARPGSDQAGGSLDGDDDSSDIPF